VPAQMHIKCLNVQRTRNLANLAKRSHERSE